MRSRTANIAAFVAAISVGMVVVGCGSGGGLSTVAARASRFACPREAPSRIGTLNPRPGVEGQMVPGGPIRMLVCLYRNMDEPDPLGLNGRRATRDRATVQEFARRLDAVSPANPEPHTCPADAGAEDIVMFGYPKGPPVLVAVGIEGCGSVGNGRGPVSEEAAVGFEFAEFVSASR